MQTTMDDLVSGLALHTNEISFNQAQGVDVLRVREQLWIRRNTMIVGVSLALGRNTSLALQPG